MLVRPNRVKPTGLSDAHLTTFPGDFAPVTVALIDEGVMVLKNPLRLDVGGVATTSTKLAGTHPVLPESRTSHQSELCLRLTKTIACIVSTCNTLVCCIYPPVGHVPGPRKSFCEVRVPHQTRLAVG